MCALGLVMDVVTRWYWTPYQIWGSAGPGKRVGSSGLAPLASRLSALSLPSPFTVSLAQPGPPAAYQRQPDHRPPSAKSGASLEVCGHLPMSARDLGLAVAGAG